MAYQQPRQQRGAQPQQLVIPDAADVGQLIINGAKHFAKKNKVITGSYLFGVLVILFAGSGTKLAYDQNREYSRILDTIDLNAEFEASNNFALANQAYRSTKGWFSCDSLCTRNKRRMEDAQRDLDAIRAEGYNRMSDAKNVAGLWSEIGVGEVKDSFWTYFTSGKKFAKRQSMWDAMFMGIRSMGRDESMIEYALKVLFQVLLNFSLGLLFAFFFFVFGLWSIVKSYQPDPISALAFFLAAVCASFAFVATYLGLIYGAAGAAVYGVAKVAETNMRIEGQRRRGVQNRPHQQ